MNSFFLLKAVDSHVLLFLYCFVLNSFVHQSTEEGSMLNRLKNQLVVAAPATEKVASENIQKKRSRAGSGKGSTRM